MLRVYLLTGTLLAYNKNTQLAIGKARAIPGYEAHNVCTLGGMIYAKQDETFSINPRGD